MRDTDQEKTCCFFGHRKIVETEELKNSICKIITDLIVNKKVDTFLFGSKSEFNTLCLKTVTKIKEKYPHIKRIYVRSAYQYIDDGYKEYLLKSYEDTYYPKNIENSGKASYVERNQEMIDKSNFCVVYYDEDYHPPKRRSINRNIFDYQPKSGTAVAYIYARNKNRVVFNTCENEKSTQNECLKLL